MTSAFIKSIRGSDVDAALHYLARMIEAGEDPRFIARRLVILASEDIGLADPTALPTAVAAAQAVQLIGMPEARLNLAQADDRAGPRPEVQRRDHGDRAPPRPTSGPARSGRCPPHLRDAHYQGAKKLGHGASYAYSHDAPFGIAEQQYAPDVVLDAEYYKPTSLGAEAAIKERWERVRRIIRGVTRDRVVHHGVAAPDRDRCAGRPGRRAGPARAPARRRGWPRLLGVE